jgi:hypothetical protein
MKVTFLPFYRLNLFPKCLLMTAGAGSGMIFPKLKFLQRSVKFQATLLVPKKLIKARVL